MVRFSEPVLDAVRLADHVEAHLTRPGGVPVAGLFSELNAIVGQDRVDVVRHGFQQVFEELPCCSSISLGDQLSDRKLAGAVDADEQVEFAFGGLHLSDVHVEEADGVALEALPLRLIALDVWQTGYAVPLQGIGAALTGSGAGSMAAMRRGSRRVAAVCAVGTPQPLPPRLGQYRRMRGLRPGLQILDRRPLPPLRDRLRVDPQLPAQRRERSLRSLYCCSDGVRGRGAPMTNLSHTASFHSNKRIAPSNRGIKHLAFDTSLTLISILLCPRVGASRRNAVLRRERRERRPGHSHQDRISRMENRSRNSPAVRSRLSPPFIFDGCTGRVQERCTNPYAVTKVSDPPVRPPRSGWRRACQMATCRRPGGTAW